MNIEKFLSNFIPVTECGCLIWERSCTPAGYGHVQINGKVRYSHRVAWEIANGPIPEGMLVLHHCDTPACGNPRHLFLGTHKINAEDRVNKKRTKGASLRIGSEHYTSKLTESQVLEIRESKEKGPFLAKKYSVSHVTIYKIKNRQHWRHI